jgi:hypothetical protein
MKQIFHERSSGKAAEERMQVELEKRNPKWFRAELEFRKKLYGANWTDGLDLHLAKGAIVVIGHRDKEAPKPPDGWLEGFVRRPASEGPQPASEEQLGLFPSRGDEEHAGHRFVQPLRWAEVAAHVQDERLHALMKARHSFDRSTYVEEWEDGDLDFIKDELLVLPDQPGEDGWATAVKFKEYSECKRDLQEWRQLSRKIPATKGFMQRIFPAT